MGTTILIGLIIYFVVMGFIILGTYYVIEEQVSLGNYDQYDKYDRRFNVRVIAVIWPIALVVSICVAVFKGSCFIFGIKRFD